MNDFGEKVVMLLKKNNMVQKNLPAELALQKHLYHDISVETELLKERLLLILQMCCTQQPTIF